MSDKNLLEVGMKILREGSLFVRRAQLIKKDIEKAKVPSKTAPVNVPGTYSLDHFAKLFGVDVFKDLPEPCATSKFDLLLGLPAVSCNELWRAWKSHFLCESPFGDALDEQIEGDAVTNPYLFRICRSVEADEDTLGMSGGEIRRKRIPAITLPEFMIAELYHFKATRGGHLNLAKSTLCAGTRFKDGSIPEVRFENRTVVIDWVKTEESSPNQGTRLVVRK
jgi:hypothetical protein